jgi:hypothetical protein
MSRDQSMIDVLSCAFAEEVEALGGTVADTLAAPPRLIVRAVLPKRSDIVPGDSVQAGVAMRADQQDVWVHPYVFRKVCSNGAIMARSAESTRVAIIESIPQLAENDLRLAVRACGSAEAFAAAGELMRGSRFSDADVALALMPVLSRWPGRAGSALLSEIVSRFFRDDDRSTYGLMNAVTSVARDTTDPETKWRLEELGGGVPALARPRTPHEPARAVAVARSAARQPELALAE